MRIISLILLLAVSCSSHRETARAKLSATTLESTAVVIPATSGTFTKEDFDLHIAQLKKRLPTSDFSIVVQPPFVVIGDEPAQVVRQRADDTIKWAVEKLKQDFFTGDPKEILDIWLFKDAASYEKHAQSIFNEHPSTPYGYYSSANKALIMNIATGAGTLVHEIVHPFIEANFPACPPWLNEGLGSLYEQCGESEGHIHGFVNWRLPGLQRAIKAGEVESFKTLMAMDANTFYSDRSGTQLGIANCGIANCEITGLRYCGIAGLIKRRRDLAISQFRISAFRNSPFAFPQFRNS